MEHLLADKQEELKSAVEIIQEYLTQVGINLKLDLLPVNRE